jgi:hypothetical protein
VRGVGYWEVTGCVASVPTTGVVMSGLSVVGRRVVDVAFGGPCNSYDYFAYA